MDEAEILTREQLMETWAEIIFTDKDKRVDDLDGVQSINGEDENQKENER